MSVAEFLDYCIEPCMLNIHLYNLEKGCVIWSGRADEIPNEYADMELCSFDPPFEDAMTLNIAEFNI